MNHLILLIVALSALLALSACGADGYPVPPSTTTSAGVTVGTNGVQTSGSVVRTTGSVSIGVGFGR